MAGKLFGSAAGVASVAVDVALHVLWYVRYQVDGNGNARVDEAGRKLSSREA